MKHTFKIKQKMKLKILSAILLLISILPACGQTQTTEQNKNAMNEKNQKPEVVVNKEELKQKLTTEQYNVTQMCSTEPPFKTSTGTTTLPECITVWFVIRRCSVQIQNLIRAQDGQVFLNL